MMKRFLLAAICRYSFGSFGIDTGKAKIEPASYNPESMLEETLRDIVSCGQHKSSIMEKGKEHLENNGYDVSGFSANFPFYMFYTDKKTFVVRRARCMESGPV